jgi:hypothetical protein
MAYKGKTTEQQPIRERQPHHRVSPFSGGKRIGHKRTRVGGLKAAISLASPRPKRGRPSRLQKALQR